MSDYTTFLTADPSLLEGAARMLDFGDTLTVFNESPTPELADFYALRMDWRAVGRDLARALRGYERMALRAH